jgi:hypothetical protein
LPCPLCDYDLRGLAEPRCPECGYRFTWEELNDPSRRLHPYLFEHHRQRSGWSFVRTLLGGMTPARVWSTLYPTQPSRPGRLLTYWVMCSLPLLTIAALHGSLITHGLVTTIATRRWGQYSGFEIARWSAYYDYRAGAYGVLSLMCLAWPWLTLAALLVFQISLRRAKLKWTHVLRSVLYTGDLSLWLTAPIGLLVLLVWTAGGWPPQNPAGGASWVIAAIVFALLNHRLLTAYRLYLRFDHAAATVAASQVMVVLLYWKVWLIAQGF